jgi:hypothetical protein
MRYLSTMPALTSLVLVFQIKIVSISTAANLQIQQDKKMLLPPRKQCSTYETYLYFAEPDRSETFLRNYQRILIDHFQKIRIDNGKGYWTCGQEYDSWN